MNIEFPNSLLWNYEWIKQSVKRSLRYLPKETSYWVAAFLTGVASVSYASLFTFAEHIFHKIFTKNPYLTLATSPLFFVVGWWLVYRYSPEARGSGIPQVMASITSLDSGRSKHPYLEKLLGLKTAGIKILSSFFCVLGGGAVGREGPTIQIAASIFHFVNCKTEKIFHQSNFNFGLIAGGAAGIAAAFNTPLGGLVYAIEELATAHFNKFKTTLISGVIISGLVSQWLLGSYLYIGYPRISTITFSVVVFASFVGAFSGLFGALFGKTLFKMNRRLKVYFKFHQLMFIAAFCGVLLAAIGTFWDAQVFGPGREVVIELLFKEKSSDLSLSVVRLIGPIISYLSGAAGGIFAPSLAAGAAIGSFVGELLQLPNQNVFILVGMIGFLTGVTRAPFTSFVLVLEMTDRHTAILPMMLASLFASLVAKLVDSESFYEHVKSTYVEEFQAKAPKG